MTALNNPLVFDLGDGKTIVASGKLQKSWETFQSDLQAELELDEDLFVALNPQRLKANGPFLLRKAAIEKDALPVDMLRIEHLLMPQGLLMRLAHDTSQSGRANAANASAAEPVAARAAIPDIPSQNRALLEEMEQQGLRLRAQHFQAGRLLSAADFTQRLGISRQAVSKAVREGRMFYLDGPNGVQWYPAFFTDHSFNRRQLEKVCKVMLDLPGASQWQFFTQPRHTLSGKTPLQALRAGQLDAVLQAARAFIET
ncbi:hypothetical protein V8J88_20240 [Massilia sp. W12]|uniref:hypothetical protein n=1 Tax=Massilia sp. W12 TaxID=3126507 RepID=UPI0030CE3485